MKTAAVIHRDTTPQPIYSNFDHELNEDVARTLSAAGPSLRAQHAAWNFCGYVSYDGGGVWSEEVWRYGELAEIRRGAHLRELIDSVNADYGAR